MKVVSNFLQPNGLYSPWNSPSQNTGVSSLSLLQGIFLTQESNWLSCIAGKFLTHSGDPGLIPGLGRSTGEGIGYPLQCSWTSLVAQLVKNLPAIWETLVRSLGWEDPLEKEKATYSSILAWRIPWTVLSMRLQRVGHKWVTFTHIP